MNRKEATEFFNSWLWNDAKRKTSGMPWIYEFKEDAISMIVDATTPKQPHDVDEFHLDND